MGNQIQIQTQTQTQTQTQNKGQNQNQKNNNNNLFELDYIHGYSGKDRENLHFLKNQNIVYYAASVGVVYNPQTNQQFFFREHTQKITCLCLHSNKEIVASGQQGSVFIFVWNAITMECICKLKAPHPVGISALSFSSSTSTNYLVTVGLDDQHTICLWDWKVGTLLTSIRGPSNKTLCVEFDPTDDFSFVLCGINHIQFCSVTNTGIKINHGAFQSRNDNVLLSLAITPENMIYTGTREGSILKWDKNSFMSTSKIKAHNGPCFIIRSVENLILSSGKDAKIKIFESSNLILQKTIQTIVAGPIRSLDFYNGVIVAGTLKNQIWLTEIDSKLAQPIIFGHSEKVSGISCHPSLNEFISTSDDRSIIMWSADMKKSIARIPINGQPIYGEYSTDGQLIAIALKGGQFTVLTTRTLKQLTNKKDTIASIKILKFSPNTHYLAICYDNGQISCYDATSSFRKVSRMTKIGTISIDWSTDSQLLRASTPTEKIAWHVNNLRKTNEKTIEWASNDIENLQFSQNNNQKTIIGNDFMAKIESFTNDITITKIGNNSTNNENNQTILSGHSDIIFDLKFLNNNYLISSGGQDECIFQWKKK